MGLFEMMEDIQSRRAEGERIINEDDIRERVLIEEETRVNNFLNRVFVKETDNGYVLRVENSNDSYIHAPNKAGYGDFKIYRVCTGSLQDIFEKRVARHSLIDVSLNQLPNFEKVILRFDKNSAGGNVFYRPTDSDDPSYEYRERCFGEGYELWIDLLDLKHDKPKSVWMNLRKNIDIGDYL